MTIPQLCLLSMCVQHCLCINQCCFCHDYMNCQSHARSLWPPDSKCNLSLSNHQLLKLQSLLYAGISGMHHALEQVVLLHIGKALPPTPGHDVKQIATVPHCHGFWLVAEKLDTVFPKSHNESSLT